MTESNDKEGKEIQKVFTFEDAHKVRTVIIDEEPWFVAKDVCEVLGLKWKGKQTLKALQKEMIRVTFYRTPTRWVGQTMQQEGLVVNEAGLYRLVMRSDKPEALKFQNWIAQEVLPSIRKHGLYMTPAVAKEAVEDTKVFLARALITAQEIIEEQQRKLEAAQPALQFMDQYVSSNRTSSITDVAALLGIPRDTFIKYLILNGILQRNIKKELYPCKKYQDSGYFKVNTTELWLHTRFTHKGITWISELLDKEV